MILTHGANSIKRGLFFDIGGTEYKCVQIGSKIWMAENLDWLFMSGSRARYYDDDQSTYGRNGLKYGLLYRMADIDYLVANIASLAPGWTVPTIDDLFALEDAVGGYQTAGLHLKSRTGWINGAGIDDFGFNGVPSGKATIDGFTGVGSIAEYALTPDNNWYYYAMLDAADMSHYGHGGYEYASIRLCKEP